MLPTCTQAKSFFNRAIWSGANIDVFVTFALALQSKRKHTTLWCPCWTACHCRGATIQFNGNERTCNPAHESRSTQGGNVTSTTVLVLFNTHQVKSCVSPMIAKQKCFLQAYALLLGMPAYEQLCNFQPIVSTGNVQRPAAYRVHDTGTGTMF